VALPGPSNLLRQPDCGVLAGRPQYCDDPWSIDCLRCNKFRFIAGQPADGIGDVLGGCATQVGRNGVSTFNKAWLPSAPAASGIASTISAEPMGVTTGRGWTLLTRIECLPSSAADRVPGSRGSDACVRDNDVEPTQNSDAIVHRAFQPLMVTGATAVVRIWRPVASASRAVSLRFSGVAGG
jgi:hypothetical protein